MAHRKGVNGPLEALEARPRDLCPVNSGRGLRERHMIPSMSRPANPSDSESAAPRVLGFDPPPGTTSKLGLGAVSRLDHNVSAEATDILTDIRPQPIFLPEDSGSSA